MGVAVLVLLVLFVSGKTPSSAQLWITVVVITLAAVVQLATTYMNTFTKARISVTLSPAASGLANFLPAAAGAPLKASPRLWVNTGAPQCNPYSSAYDPRANGCLAFAQSFVLDAPAEDIYVSVDDVMQELRDRVLRLESVNLAVISAQVGATGAGAAGPAPIAEDK